MKIVCLLSLLFWSTATAKKSVGLRGLQSFNWLIEPDINYPQIVFNASSSDGELAFKYFYEGELSDSRTITYDIRQYDCLGLSDGAIIPLNEDTSIPGELFFEADIVQANITDSIHYTELDDTTSLVSFCIRVDYNFVSLLDEIESINFHETKYTVTIDRTAGFNITGITTNREGADALECEADLDFAVEAYFCDEADNEIFPNPFAQGDYMQVCIRVDDAVVTEDIIVEDVMSFIVSQPLGPGRPSIAVLESQSDLLTTKRCSANGICNIKTQLKSEYFVDFDPNDLAVDGTALLAFGGQRLLKEQEEEPKSMLADDFDKVSLSHERQLEHTIGNCMQENYLAGGNNQDLTCTAKEVYIEERADGTKILDFIRADGPAGECQFPGDTITLSVYASLHFNADRQDVGIYTRKSGLPGTSALDADQCYVDTLPLSCPGGVDDCIVTSPGSTTRAGTIGIFDVKPSPNPADTCGDVSLDAGGGGTLDRFLFQTLTLTCNDSDGDGFLDFPTCFTWRVAGSDSFCDADDPTSIIPGSPSKCFCETSNFVDPPILVPATMMPSRSPTSPPTPAPTNVPTVAPTRAPTSAPVAIPATIAPTRAPTSAPVAIPATTAPTRAPTSAPVGVLATVPPSQTPAASSTNALLSTDAPVNPSNCARRRMLVNFRGKLNDALGYDAGLRRHLQDGPTEDDLAPFNLAAPLARSAVAEETAAAGIAAILVVLTIIGITVYLCCARRRRRAEKENIVFEHDYPEYTMQKQSSQGTIHTYNFY